MRINERCQGKDLVNQAQHHAHAGILLPGPKPTSPQEMILLHTDAPALCSRFEGMTYMHPEWCYAALIPNLERAMNLLVKNLSAVIHASGTVKKLETSEQSLKLNQRGARGGVKLPEAILMPHLSASSIA